MDDLERKIQFARFLFRDPANPFNAATSVFPDDIGEACKAALEWTKDETVINEIERLKAEKPDEIIPDKNEALLLAWRIANNAYEAKDRISALRLFAEISGHMPDKTINKNIKTEESKINKVMLVKDHGSNEEWESDLLNQQGKLVNYD